ALFFCHSERSEESRIFLGAKHFDFAEGTRSRAAPNSICRYAQLSCDGEDEGKDDYITRHLDLLFTLASRANGWPRPPTAGGLNTGCRAQPCRATTERDRNPGC